jgi:glyoxylase-like metal-dependent hydrolase (beta-lactamase superfamily II)
MTIHSIDTGLFKLDGGAMFGVVPKSMWQKLYPADDNNMCTWAMRCMLIEENNRLILIDTGIGNKQDDKFFSHYYLHGDDSLQKSIESKGYSMDDVTDVILTHLHFDHCGGAITRQNEKLIPAFKNAKYWSNEQHWHTATQPNAREKASFLKDNIMPIMESGQLSFIKENEAFSDSIQFIFVHGHTEAMMLPLIQYNNQKILYCAELLPSPYHIPLPYVMGYDMQPLITMQEKKEILEKAATENYLLFFEHDATNVCATVENTEKGVRVKEKFTTFNF